MLDILKGLSGVDEYQDVSLRLFLQAALSADALGWEAIAYDFMTRASALFEDTADSRLQVQALQQTIGTLNSCQHFSEDNYDTLIKNTAKYANKLMKNQDKVQMICQCAHLFWTGRQAIVDDEGNATLGEPRHADASGALGCLKRALRIADNIMEPVVKVQLFIYVLNEYLYFFAQACPKVEAKYITGLFGVIREHKDGLDENDEKTEIEAQFKRTVKFIKNKISEGGPDATRYEAITK